MKKNNINKSWYSVILSLLLIGFIMVLSIWIFRLILNEMKNNRAMWDYIKSYAITNYGSFTSLSINVYQTSGNTMSISSINNLLTSTSGLVNVPSNSNINVVNNGIYIITGTTQSSSPSASNIVLNSATNITYNLKSIYI